MRVSTIPPRTEEEEEMRPTSIQYDPPIVSGADFEDGLEWYFYAMFFMMIVTFLSNFWIGINQIASVLVCVVLGAFFVLIRKSLQRKVVILYGALTMGVLASLIYEVQRPHPTTKCPEPICATASPTVAQFKTDAPTANATAAATNATRV